MNRGVNKVLRKEGRALHKALQREGKDAKKFAKKWLDPETSYINKLLFHY